MMAVILLEGVDVARSPDRLYSILPCDSYGYYTGRTADGRQLVAGAWSHDLVVGLFDEAGSLEVTHSHTLDVGGGVEQCLLEWYGYTPGLVRVKRFRIPLGPNQPVNLLQRHMVGEDGLAVAPFPLYWRECYCDPPTFTADDPDYVETVREWIKAGNCVLYWGNEYILDSSGEVVGS